MKKMNNKGFLLVETLIVAAFTLTVLVILFLQFKNLIVNYNNSYNYNTVEGIYKLNSVKNYIIENQSASNSFAKKLGTKEYLLLYKNSDGACKGDLGLATNSLNYCYDIMENGNFKVVLYTSSNINKLKEKLKRNNDSNISEGMKNFIKGIDSINDQERLIAEFKDGTFATITFGVINKN